MKNDTRLAHARDVLRLEADAVRAQIDHLGAPFLAACELLLATRGHVIVTGLGKSGHIGEKIAATLASTGTPAFFVHAAEAGHGDLGMITADDTILAISYSGESQEILMMLPIVRALGVKTIALTGRPQSSMAAGRPAPARRRRKRSLPARPRADHQHHRDPGAWRRACHHPDAGAAIQ